MAESCEQESRKTVNSVWWPGHGGDFVAVVKSKAELTLAMGGRKMARGPRSAMNHRGGTA